MRIHSPRADMGVERLPGIPREGISSSVRGRGMADAVGRPPGAKPRVRGWQRGFSFRAALQGSKPQGPRLAHRIEPRCILAYRVVIRQRGMVELYTTRDAGMRKRVRPRTTNSAPSN
jgi:hypothetical protein